MSDNTKIVRLETTLFGGSGANGLVSKSKDHDVRIRALEIAQAVSKMKLGLLFGAIGGIGGGVAVSIVIRLLQ
jgi:hypothetical protein